MKKENIRDYDLNQFYLEWEKFARKDYKELLKYKSNFDLFNDDSFKRFMAASPVITFVINHANSAYEFFSDNCYSVTGYTAREFIEGGVPFGMSITEKSHTLLVAEYLIPQVFKYCHMYRSTGELADLRFSYNYRIVKKNGERLWTLHLMNVLETDDQGDPLLTLVHMVDIHHIKKDEKVDFCVSKKNDAGIYEPIYLNSYPQDQHADILTTRELEILRLISQGESSKSIAQILRLSIHTIHNHRKKILKKTGVKNSSELINYGRCKGISLPSLK